MKKIIAFLLVAIMAFSFAACGGVDTPEVTDGSGNTENTDSTTGTTGVESGKTDSIDFEQIKSFEDIPVISEKNRWILKSYIEEVYNPGIVLPHDFVGGSFGGYCSQLLMDGKIVHLNCFHFNYQYDATRSNTSSIFSSYQVLIQETDCDKFVKLITEYFGDKVKIETKEETESYEGQAIASTTEYYSIQTKDLSEKEIEQLLLCFHMMAYEGKANAIHGDKDYKTFADERKDTPIPKETTAFVSINSFEDIPVISEKDRWILKSYIEEVYNPGMVSQHDFVGGLIVISYQRGLKDNVVYSCHFSIDLQWDKINSKATETVANYFLRAEKAECDRFVELITKYFGDKVKSETETHENTVAIETYSINTKDLSEKEIEQILQCFHMMTYEGKAKAIKGDKDYKTFADERKNTPIPEETTATESTAETTPPVHVHTFEETWTTNESHHWHKATCEHSKLREGLEWHSFGLDFACSVCGYKQSEERLGMSSFADIKSFADVPEISAKNRELFLKYAEQEYGSGLVLGDEHFFENYTDSSGNVKSSPILLYKLGFEGEIFTNMSFRYNWQYTWEQIQQDVKPSSVLFSTPIKMDEFEKTRSLLMDYFGDKVTKEEIDEEYMYYQLDTKGITQEEVEKLHEIIHMLYYRNNEDYREYVDSHYEG